MGGEGGVPPGPGGSYQLGFTLQPLTADGGLDTSGDYKGGAHTLDEDPLYNMALENRDGGNKMVQAGRHEEAIGRYSELIMQARQVDQECDIIWTDEGHDKVRMLRATAYLNLSLCFLKTKQWTHASNTATRAIIGDKDPPDPKEDILPPEKKAKALFRRAQAEKEGFENYEKAVADLRKALTYTPDDKAIQQELNVVEHALAKTQKAADKKMAGFLSGNKKVQSGEGIFDDSLRTTDTSCPHKLPTEPVKLSDGLFIVPKDEEKAPQTGTSLTGEALDFDELSREINELKEENPETFDKLRDQVKEFVEKEAAAAEADASAETATATEAGAPNEA